MVIKYIMKKIFYIFLTAVILLISSCEDTSVPVIYDFRDFDFTEDITITTEQEFYTDEIEETTIEIIEIAETIKKDRELIYNAPYTADEIKDVFNDSKELFENIKDIKMPDGYNYFLAKNYPCKIEFYDCNNTNNHIFYDIDENNEYKLILDFFDKFEYIYFIHSINPDIEDYSDEDIIALFRLQMILPDSETEYIPWAEIRYNRNSGEIKEEITSEYIIIPLDDYWYYIYGTVWFD